MKKMTLLILFLLMTLGNLFSQSLLQFEYFFNSDPGVGKATNVNLEPENAITLVDSINTSNLNYGFHILGIRFKNINGVWSLTEFESFYKLKIQENDYLITQMEYFINSDPGVGNAIQIELKDSSVIDFQHILRDSTSGFSVAGLSQGTHRAGIRFKDLNGNWTLTQYLTFNICQTDGTVADFDYFTLGNEVTFTNDSYNSNNIQWNFGDGTIINQINPSHKYNQIGSYNVKLKSTNSCDIDSIVKVVDIVGVNDYNPKSIVNGAWATITFNGVGFTDSTKIELIDSTENPIVVFKPDSIILNQDKTILRALFKPQTFGYNVWDLKISNFTKSNYSQTFKSGLKTDSEYEIPEIQIQNFYPNGVRTGRNFKITSRLTNLSKSDAYMVPIKIIVPSNFEIKPFFNEKKIQIQ